MYEEIMWVYVINYLITHNTNNLNVTLDILSFIIISLFIRRIKRYHDLYIYFLIIQLYYSAKYCSRKIKIYENQFI